MAGRRKILQRSGNPLVLQPRDSEILKKVFDYRFLCGEQIKNLCGFNCLKRTNDRLRKLFDNGFLSRRLFIDAFKKRILYLPGPRAAEIISLKTGLDSSEIAKKRFKAVKTRDSFLSHFLSINNFRYSLEICSHQNCRMKTEIWRYKPALFSEEEARIYPDAYFRLGCPDKTYSFLLEIDRSTENLKRIKKKMEDYLDYGLSGDFQRQFGFQNQHFRLLIVCKTLVRLKTLLRTIEKITDKSFCWLTVEKDVSPEKIFSQIWHRPNKEGVFSLI
ncbi:MAG: replication-relaxation family protein [Candidatus Omnitrophota bacterium]|jgi:hypothetical protein